MCVCVGREINDKELVPVIVETGRSESTEWAGRPKTQENGCADKVRRPTAERISSSSQRPVFLS